MVGMAGGQPVEVREGGPIPVPGTPLWLHAFCSREHYSPWKGLSEPSPASRPPPVMHMWAL